MEIFELANIRKAFLQPRDRYTNPHREAMKLRYIWTSEKPPNRSRDMQTVKHLWREATKCVDDGGDLSHARRLIKKGLSLDAKSHALYALRGRVAALEEKWCEAIRSYETARLFVKRDRKVSSAQLRALYIKPLIECYWKRGSFHYEAGSFLEAVRDLEQILILRLSGTLLTQVQDRLLEILKKMDKYEAYVHYWHQFIMNAEPARSSVLLTEHAEYKIYLREIATARHILFEALELDRSNVEAQQLLQLVYDTGHTMAAYTVIWCMHGCYEKALVAIEKGRDCDPYNPGYTLLKTIILRLCGRPVEAATWLQSVDRGFYKLLEPSRDMRGSIMGNLSIEKTRTELIKQWHLIRYDLAVKHAMDGEYGEVCDIVQDSRLKDLYPEPYMLLGDAFLHRDKPDLALEMYSRCLKKMKESKDPRPSPSRKRVDLVQRIVDILNNRAHHAVEKKRSKEAIEIAERVLETLDSERIGTSRLGVQRGDALLCKARGHFQIGSPYHHEQCRRSAADSLRFLRDPNDAGLRDAVFTDMPMERVIDRFGSRKQLPYSLKILMQYS